METPEAHQITRELAGAFLSALAEPYQPPWSEVLDRAGAGWVVGQLPLPGITQVTIERGEDCRLTLHYHPETGALTGATLLADGLAHEYRADAGGVMIWAATDADRQTGRF